MLNKIFFTIFFLFVSTNLYSGESKINFTLKEKQFIKTHTYIPVAVLDDYMPFSYIENGSIKGFSIDLLKKISENTGLILKPEADKWYKNLNNFKANKIDIIDCISYKKKRTAFTLYTKPYYKIPILVFGRENFNNYRSMNDLKNKKTGILKNIFYEDELRKINGLNIVEIPDSKSLMTNLSYGKIDACITTFQQGNHYIKKYSLPNIKILGELQIGEYIYDDLRIGVNKNKPVLFSIINKGLESVSLIELEKLKNRWIGVSRIKKEKRVELNQKELNFLDKTPVIRVGNESDWAPFDFNEEGVAKGFSIDLLEKIALKTGLKIEYINGFTWSELLNKFEKREIDLLPAIWKNNRRKQYASFTDSYFTGNLGVFINSENINIKDIYDLENKKIGLIDSNALNEVVLNKFKNIKPVFHKSVHEQIKSLSSNKTDAIIAFPFVTKYHQVKNQIVNIKVLDYLDLTQEELNNLSLYIGTRSDWPELNSIIQKGLNEISDEEIKKIQNKWISSLFSEKNLFKNVNFTKKERQYLKNKKNIFMCVDPDWMPYEKINKKGEHTGIIADYINLAEKRINTKINVFPTSSWKDTLESAKKRECDIISGSARTRDRIRYLNFTTPYLSYPNVIATKKDQGFIDDIGHYLNKKFAVIEGYAVASRLIANYPGIYIDEVSNIKEGLLKVSSGKVFGFIDSLPSISYNIQKHGMTDLKISGRLDHYEKISIAVRKDDPILYNILEKTINSITEKDHQQIYNKWLAVRIEQGFDYALFWRVIPVILVVLLIILYWNMKLSKEIDKRIEVEKELLKAKDKAEIANRTKSEFLANMSHELRTPLNAVIGFSELLGSMKIDKKQKSYAESIKASGRSLLTLINDILDLSKIEAGMLEIKPNLLSIRKLINDISLIFKQQIESKGLEFIIEIKNTVPDAIILDEIRLRQILINLLGNAHKFTDKGHIRLKVEAFESFDDKNFCKLIISVEDTGIGINPVYIDTIFESFKQQQGQSIKKYGGTGLGLAICQKLANAMGGKINAKSQLSKGSLFSLILEKVETAVVEESMLDYKKGIELKNVMFPNASIVAADDILSNREVITEILTKAGIKVFTAKNGKIAVDLVNQHMPHLILMDIVMPVMDGIEAAKNIKNNPLTKDIPVVALTASSGFFPDKIIKETFDEYLEKPFKIDDLIHILTKYMKAELIFKEKEKENSKKIIDIDTINKSKEFIDALSNYVLPKCESLDQVMIISSVEDLGYEVKDLGHKFNSAFLKNSGDKILGYCDTFDTIKIEEELFKLKSNIKKLINGLENKNGKQ